MSLASSFRTGALAVAALTLVAGPAQAADAPRLAWGKAGISYDQYRDEAYDCAMVGLETDVSDTEPVEALRSATRQMEALESRQAAATSSDPAAAAAAGVRHAQEVEAVRNSARAEQQVEEVKRIVFSTIQQCMIERGYTRFALTEEQRREIEQFDDGSPERRVALYQLASDAAILEAQKQPLPPATIAP
jgi:hypothetical protein